MTAATAPAPIFVRMFQVQEVFGIHRVTVYRLARAGKIKIHKRGTSSFVRASDMIALIEGGDQ
ncbi:helix-turn-helix domain-containing protein [uncultured Paracoccus sp.]|uniref:helix-turn-helix domain-containing protein n=1 Tax=uncultured Paracoccus sp. TaxID=189685 RepID=UPI0025E2962D|nr:helix-turn-helix domain-containing protein [uncultured Paracoccus sp.]